MIEPNYIASAKCNFALLLTVGTMCNSCAMSCYPIKLFADLPIKKNMERETILATFCKMDEPDAEIVRQRLESGDLLPAGNFRNEPAAYWKEDEDNG